MNLDVASSAPTRTASRPRRRTSSSGARPGRRRTISSSSPATPARRTGSKRSRKLKHRRDVTLPYTLVPAADAGGGAVAVQRAEPREERGRPRPTCTASPTPARRSAGSTRGCSTRRSFGAEGEAGAGSDRQARPTMHRHRVRRSPRHRPDASTRSRPSSARLARVREAVHACSKPGTPSTSPLFSIARHCVRLADELPKKSPDRLREYRDSNLESLKFQLFTPAPIYPDLERAKLTASLTFLAENLGGEHPLVKLVLAGKNPAARADELVAGTKLSDPAERKRARRGRQEGRSTRATTR